MAKPSVVLETGVANGHSTFFLLNAIFKNGRGELHGVDISHNVGSLIQDEEHSNWHLEILKPLFRASFRNAVKKIPQIEFFLHDSDHRYFWQSFEYATVYPKMATNSIFASDDIDSSFAFLDFTRKLGQVPLCLIGRRRVFGLLRVGGSKLSDEVSPSELGYGKSSRPSSLPPRPSRDNSGDENPDACGGSDAA
jgi:hypothetical protein